MLKDTVFTAIDVGTSKICTLVARRHVDGRPELLGVGISPSQGLRKGVVVGIREAQEAIQASVAEAAHSSGASISGAYVGITGSHLEFFTRWGSIHTQNYSDPLSSRQVEQALNAAYPAELPPDKQVLHLIPQTYSVDGLTGVHNPVGMHAGRLDVETLCVVAAAAPVQQLMHAVENAKVPVNGLVMSGLACGESVLTPDEKEAGVVLVEIGGGATTVSVFQQGTLRMAAVLPLGGHQFTTDMAVALNTPYDVAEEAKLRYGQALHESIGDERVEIRAFGDRRTVKVERRQFCRYLHDRAEEVLRLSSLKVRSFGYPGVLPAGVVLAGGGASLPGIDTVARNIFNAPVRIGRPTGLLGGSDGILEPAYASSTGLLLWSMQHHARREELRHGGKGATGGNGNGHWSPIGWLRGHARGIASEVSR